jgi:hypothetical protein
MRNAQTTVRANHRPGVNAPIHAHIHGDILIIVYSLGNTKRPSNRIEGLGGI